MHSLKTPFRARTSRKISKWSHGYADRDIKFWQRVEPGRFTFDTKGIFITTDETLVLIQVLTGTSTWMCGWNTLGGCWAKMQPRNANVSIFMFDVELLSLKMEKAKKAKKVTYFINRSISSSLHTILKFTVHWRATKQKPLLVQYFILQRSSYYAIVKKRKLIIILQITRYFSTTKCVVD